jgi:serine/threonine protein kinase
MWNAGEQRATALGSLLKPGQVVDRKYRVSHLIGSGGMATVWAGENKRTGKRVALKIIQESLRESEDARERFRREALAAGRINHPNVVTVFDVLDLDGHDCIIMEMLEGETLAERLARKGLLDPDEAFALLLPAMRGVATAHAYRVIHRDLKPHNVFICVDHDGEYVTTKVLDFGISKIIDPAHPPGDLTVAGATVGTPAYLAPEFAYGSRHIDQRADIYGFGVILYETFSGRRPFEGAKTMELFSKILNEDPEPLATYRPDLPAEVLAIVQKAMARDPKDRYRSMESLIGAIESLLPPSPIPRSLTPIRGVPAVPFHELRTGERGSRPRLWAALGAAAATLVGLLLWAMLTHQAPPPVPAAPPQATVP